MTRKTKTNARKKKLAMLLLLVFFASSSAVFALSFLPWFGYLRGDQKDNPYDLLALDSLSENDRRAQIDKWANEWRGLSEDQRAERADQFLDSVVDVMEDKLDLDKDQKVDTKSLVKGAVMIARQSGIRGGPDLERHPERRKEMEALSEKVKGQLEQILTPEQRSSFQELVEERERRVYERTGRTPPESQK